MEPIGEYDLQDALLQHLVSSSSTSTRNDIPGDVEPWLEKTNVVLSLSGFDNTLAIADKTSFVFIVNLSSGKCEKLNESYLPDETTIEEMIWISKNHIAVGYSSGILNVYTKNGDICFSRKLYNEKIVHLDVCVKSGSSGDVSYDLWVLYSDGIVFALPCQSLWLREIERKKVVSLHCWKLEGQSEFSVATCCGATVPTLFQSHGPFKSNCIISGGSDPPIAFFNAGGDQRSAHLGQIASVVATKVATVAISAVSSFAKSWGWYASENQETQDTVPLEDDIYNAEELPLYRGLEDPRRRILSLTLDPDSRLALSTDTFGRVLLLDTRYMQIIRMWKGYRNCQCAWMQWPERWSKQNDGAPIPLDPTLKPMVSYGLYIVIYAPLRGILEVWRARYGPCILSIPVGSNARVVTSYSGNVRGEGRARCFILNGNDDDKRKIALNEIIPDENHLSSVYEYFSQNNNQEATLVLHQFISNLRTSEKLLLQQKIALKDPILQSHLEEMLSCVQRINCWNLVEKLMEELAVPKTGVLGVDFHLKVTLLMLQMIMKRKSNENSINSLQRLKLLWRHRILTSYKQLYEECGSRCHRNQPADFTLENHQDVPTSQAGKELNQLVHFILRIYSETSSSIASSFSPLLPDGGFMNLSTLNCIEFLDAFHIPKTIPLDRIPFSKEEETFVLKASFRASFTRSLKDLDSMSSTVQQKVLDFLFSPLLEDIFAVQNIRRIHTSLLIEPENHALLFLKWFFSLSVSTLLLFPSPLSSLPLHRMLLILLRVEEEDAQEQEEEQKNHHQHHLVHHQHHHYGRKIPVDHSEYTRVVLPPMSKAAIAIFKFCKGSSLLLHAYLLAYHCSVAEEEIAQAEEARTIGAISSAGAGKRWKILQSCLLRTIYLSLRLGASGKMTADMTETADDILRFIARIQLQQSWNVPEIVKMPLGENLNHLTSFQNVMEELTSCQTKAELISASAIFVSFPGYVQPCLLSCFRAMELCKVWDRQPSQMKLLSAAVQHIKAISKMDLRCGAGLAIWMHHLRIPAYQLLQHWIENKKEVPKRNIQPEVARPLFSLQKEVLEIIVSSLPNFSTKPNPDENQGEEEDSDSDLEIDLDNRSMKKNNRYLSDLMEKNVRLQTGKSSLDSSFQLHWPPTVPKLSKNLMQYQENPPNLRSLEQHLELVKIMDALVALNLEADVLSLFPRDAQFCTTFGFPYYKEDQDEKSKLEILRLKFVIRILRHDDKLALSLAESFRLPMDKVRQERVLNLYLAGKDELAQEVIMQVKNDRTVGPGMAAIARWRLAVILKQMQSSSQYAPLMSNMPADICTWIAGDAPPFELVSLRYDNVTPSTSSLAATHSLLLRSMQFVDSSTSEYSYLLKMIQVAKNLLETVQWCEQG